MFLYLNVAASFTNYIPKGLKGRDFNWTVSNDVGISPFPNVFPICISLVFSRFKLGPDKPSNFDM